MMAFIKLLRRGISLSHICRNHSTGYRYCSEVIKGKWMVIVSGSPERLLQRKLLNAPYFFQERGVSVEITSHVPGSLFRHDENLNAVRLLKSLPDYKNLMFQSNNLVEEVHLQVPLSQTGSLSSVARPDSSGWRDSVAAFIDTSLSSQEAKIPVTHPKNQAVVQQLLKEVSKLTDDELCQVLYYMRLFAPCPSVKDPAYMTVWKELDKECATRRTSWSLDFCFVVADLWYGMNLARHSEFHWSLLKRLFRKCDKLSKEHFVRFMFCLNLNRDIPDNISVYDLEYSLNKMCSQLTPEEVVVIAMAFFKTQTPIRDQDLLRRLLTIFLTRSESMDSVSVAGIAKLARYSSTYKSGQVIRELQEKFIPELPRLSITACTHLALTGTNCLSPHKQLLQLVVNRIQEDVTEARLKELERVALAMTMFNADCDELAKQIGEELQRPERADEIRKYGRCLPAILHYLSIRNVFIPDLMSMCLSKAFRDTYYGRGKEVLQRELLCLDIAADIELEDYTGKRLDPKSFDLIMKKNMLRIRPQKVKVPAYEKFVRSVTDTFQAIVKDAQFFHVCAILPQHHTLSLVYCHDTEGKLVRIPKYLTELETYQLKKLESVQNISYHALILCGRNMYFYNSKELSGQANLQLRQIQKLGYKPHLVYFCDWETLTTAEQRINHINTFAVVSNSTV